MEDLNKTAIKGANGAMSRRGFLGVATSVAALTALAATGCAPSPSSTSSNTSDTPTNSTTSASAQTGETLLPNKENLNFSQSVQCEPDFVADPITDDQVTETIDVDVVVCGAGMAGTTAAASASQNGLNVLLLEKGTTFAARGSEIGAINDPLHTAAGVTVDPAELLGDALSFAHYRADRFVWQQYIDRSGEAMAWAMETSSNTPTSECGEFSVVGDHSVYEGVKTWATGVRVQGGTSSFVKMMLDNAELNGAEIRFETPACQLITDESGAVTGVFAKGEDGYIKVNASKGVVLATGGYDNNWDCLTERIRPRDLAVYAWINPTMTESGDGHLMATAINAAEDDYPHILMNDPGGCTAGFRANGAIFAFPRVNEDGKRFVNESQSFELVNNALMYQPGAHDYLLLSGDLLAAFDIMKGVIPWTAEDMYENCKDVLIEADSIDELADKIGVNKENLKATVERYNELCAKGVDEDFGKNPTTLLPLDEAPFYAIEESGSCLTSVSGLKINKNSQVLDNAGAVIPNLYALGNTSGSMFFGTYPHHISAVSHGRCVCFGYLVGRRLAGLEDEE